MRIVFLMDGEKPDYKALKQSTYTSEQNKKMILKHQIERYASLSPQEMIFCARKEDFKKFNFDAVINENYESPIAVKVCGQTAGSVCTALLAAEYIDNDDEVIFVKSEDLIALNILEIVEFFRFKNSDAGVVSFRSEHPGNSFAQKLRYGNACENTEKKSTMEDDWVGFCYFRKGSDFVKCAKNVIRKDNKINNAFHLSQVMDEMTLRWRRVGIYSMDNAYPLKIKTQHQKSLKKQLEVY